MTPEEEDVAQANESFYRAFESLDIKKMEAVWTKDGEIQCGHPGWRILRGWEAVMESWRQIFEEHTGRSDSCSPTCRSKCAASSAWVTLYENLNSSLEGQNVAAMIFTTNIFHKGPDGWRMIHHHGSTVAQPPPRSQTPTVH